MIGKAFRDVQSPEDFTIIGNIDGKNVRAWSDVAELEAASRVGLCAVGESHVHTKQYQPKARRRRQGSPCEHHLPAELVQLRFRCERERCEKKNNRESEEHRTCIPSHTRVQRNAGRNFHRSASKMNAE